MRLRLLGLAAGVLVVVALIVLIVPGDRHSSRTQSTSTTLAARPCRPSLNHGILPRWTRNGFTDAKPRMPHIVGRAGLIAGLVFGDPLQSPPPPPPRTNKILWVSRVSGGLLTITAQRMNGRQQIGTVVRRSVNDGPSIVDLPAPGCWRLSLAWSGHRDSLDIRYLSATSGTVT